ncbi:MAG: penicillin-binding transpeptidase domain-containing protein [Bdellovibrionota bacterium]
MMNFFKSDKPSCLQGQVVKKRKRYKLKKQKIFSYLAFISCFFVPAFIAIYYFGFHNPSNSVKKLIVQTNIKKEAPKPRMNIKALGSLEKFPPVKLLVNLKDNSFLLTKIPSFDEELYKTEKSLKAVSRAGNIVFFSLDPELQSYTTSILEQAEVPHVALVALEPKTGRVVAMDGLSDIPNFELYAGLPAASLFKIVTATAALEAGVLRADSRIAYRGSDYILNKYNYAPSGKLDKRHMSLSDALGKSCNPVFGRVALKYLNQATLMNYANRFGFNEELPFDMIQPSSEANIPEGDYELSRTGAGFGDVRISPLHAAMIMAGVANKGVIPKPYMISRVVAPTGEILYKSKPQVLQEVMNKGTADELLKMMAKTTTSGTSKKYFRNFEIPVSAKTGTLNGDNPKGLTNWFIASAPSNDPQIAVAIVIVHNGKFMKTASQLGRMFLDKYFKE